jgi:hypothetical protein
MTLRRSKASIVNGTVEDDRKLILRWNEDEPAVGGDVAGYHSSEACCWFISELTNKQEERVSNRAIKNGHQVNSR